MDNQKKKCSQIEHKESDAITYCYECNLYMCNKCENSHLILFKNHHKYTLDKDLNDIFTGLCKEKNHCKELKYYCKDHNTLCCALCISKIKDEENGQHKDCKIYIINEIKEEKKLKLKENLKCLEELSNNLEKSINELKQIFEKADAKKNELKTGIQKIFTKIRNDLNEREDKLFEEIDKTFGEFFINDDVIKKSEKLPNKIKSCLEKSQINDDYWKEEKKICSLINEAINIENSIKDINNIFDVIKNSNKIDLIDTICFSPEEKELDTFLSKIKTFGEIIVEKSNFDDNSTIIKNKYELYFVLKQIRKNNNIAPNKKCDLKIIYRMSRDGDSCSTYHQKTNNIPDTLTLIKTKQDIIFGGYTHIKIPSCNGQNFKDEKAFVFSLEYKKIYLPNKYYLSKHSNDAYGPIFGNSNTEYPILIFGPNFSSSKNHFTSTVNTIINYLFFKRY
jgi:hypothetical protein